MLRAQRGGVSIFRGKGMGWGQENPQSSLLGEVTPELGLAGWE